MTVIRLIVGQFTLACMAHYATLAVLPVFLLENKSLKPEWIGAIFLFASIAGKFARIFLSVIIDSFRPGNILPISCLCSAGVLFLLPETSMALLIAIFLFLFNLSNGANSISVRAMIAAHGEKSNNSQSNFTRLSVGSSVASFLGPPLSFFILHSFTMVTPFHVFGMILVFTALALFPKRKTLPDIETQSNIIHGIKSVIKKPGFMNLMIFVLLFYFCNSLLYTSISVYTAVHLHMLEWAGILLSISAVTLIIFALPVNKLCEHFSVTDYGRIRLGAALYFFAFLFIIVGQNIYWLSVAMIFWGLGEGIMDPTVTKKVTSLVSPELYISSLTIQSIIVGIGEGIGSFIGIPAASDSSSNGVAGFIAAAIICVFMFFASILILKLQRNAVQNK